jgi:hypothetical protein
MLVWMLIAVAVFNVGLACRNIRLLWRYHRQLDQVNALHCLLATVCIQAFQVRAAPIWQAWANSMGTFKVNIEVERERTTTPSKRSPRRVGAASPE